MSAEVRYRYRMVIKLHCTYRKTKSEAHSKYTLGKSLCVVSELRVTFGVSNEINNTIETKLLTGGTVV